jgi:hypothetical protein
MNISVPVRFHKLQGDLKAARGALATLGAVLDARYGSRQYARAAERHRLARLDARVSKLSDAYFALLREISPRSWESCVPWAWVIESLTFEDATTRGPLSVVPPHALMFAPADVRALAAPIKG